MGVGRRNILPPAPPAPPAELPTAADRHQLGWTARSVAQAAGRAIACHDGPMTDQGERYDRMAAGYDRWWAPVLAPSATALLDRLEPTVALRRGRPARRGHRDRQPGHPGDPSLANGPVDRDRRLAGDGRGRVGHRRRAARARRDGLACRRNGARRRAAVRRWVVRCRDVVLRPAARPEPRPGTARDPASPASGRHPGLRHVALRIGGRSRPDRVFDGLLDEYRVRRRREATTAPATSRQWRPRSTSCAAPDSVTSRHPGRPSTTASR